MKIKTLAWSTFDSFLHNRLIFVLLIICVGVVLLMLTPLLGAKAMATAQGATQTQIMVLQLVSAIMGFVSGFGSLLAAWAAADAVGSEMASGTILAVMARPVRRWEFLVGKFCGVMLLMAVYVLMMFGLSYLLAWIGGERIQSTPWVLLAYPMVRYAIYAAIGVALVTVLRPIVTMGFVALLALGAALASSPNFAQQWEMVREVMHAMYWILPSTNLLSESRFLEVTHASLKQAGWVEHLTTIAYGLDYALVCMVLAIWSFHYRSLKRD